MKKILSIVMIAAVAHSAWAVPARRGALVRTAADGTQKTVYLHGNEHFHYLRIPIEMEFHTRHFYARGGLSFGIGIEAWTAANAKECINIGETVLELGGRIPLTTNDILTIGVNSNISVGFDKVYHDGVAYPGLSPSPPRFGACIKLGYEHRF